MKKITELIKELQKEISRGDEVIFIEHEGTTYEFDLGIDGNGQPLIITTQPTAFTN